MAGASPAWERARLALALLAVDPAGLGGIVVRARTGPVMQAFLEGLSALPAPLVRVPPHATDARLFGGVDVAATLASDRIVHETGVLAGAGCLLLPMAERIGPALAARLAQSIDAVPRPVVALDEGAEDEGLPSALAERMAFRIDLDGLAMGDLTAETFPADRVAAARTRLGTIAIPAELALQIASCTLRLGIDSLRAPSFALHAARAHAALRGSDVVAEPDLLAAIDLTLAHRATRIPQAEDDAPAEPDPEPGDTSEARDPGPDSALLPDEILLDAVRANLPPGLLEGLATQAMRRGHGSGSGARRRGNRRGRPLPSRPGRLDGAARIDIVASLRAAAPWQRIRAAEGDARRVRIHPSDIHVKRFEEKSDRLLIFTVDASGSAALARLAEAKGAVELLLAQAYARRDHVALVAFRGTEAQVLLPPTRSLVRTKRQLAALPGGGGTPLAAGLLGAMDLAGAAKARGLTPTIVLLTDGRANVALDGTADRARAASDARDVARALRGQGCDAIVLDTGNRPEKDLAALAGVLGGVYLPLPRADARRLSGAVSAALGG